MPRPAGGDGRYMAGLDGLRAVAVLAVVLYHLNVGWASGGLLGVGVFFVLSGYLITDLLLAEREREGAIALGRFWLRRARRLLPALWVMLVVVTLWIALLEPSQPAPGLAGLLAPPPGRGPPSSSRAASPPAATRAPTPGHSSYSSAPHWPSSARAAGSAGPYRRSGDADSMPWARSGSPSSSSW